MPKPITAKQTIHLDLLKPQSNPEKLPVKLLRWLLATGRYILIFVEALVLIAFIARFKLDADLANTKEGIEKQIPYIESLKSTEILIRQTQFKLTTIDSFYKNYPDFPVLLQKIANQTPAGVKIVSLNLEKSIAQVDIRLSAEAQTNNDLAIFINGLKTEPLFSNVNLSGIGLDKGNLTFFLTATAKSSAEGKI